MRSVQIARTAMQIAMSAKIEATARTARIAKIEATARTAMAAKTEATARTAKIEANVPPATN